MFNSKETDRIKNLVESYLEKNNNIDQWDKSLRDQYHLDAINLILDLAKDNEHYKGKMHKLDSTKINNLDEFKKIEFTTKDELRGKPYKTVCVDKSKLAQLNISTGTTGGDNIFCFYTMNDLYCSEIQTKYPELIPLKETDIVVNALPYEMSSAGISLQRVFQVGERAIVLPAGKGGVYSTPKKTVELMHKLQAEVLMTSPSYAATLYEYALESHLDPIKDFNLNRIWLTGEGCSDTYRKRIEKIWGAPAYFYYGSLECGSLGMECRYRNGYHIPEAHVYMEIINPETGETCNEGEIGEIVTTTLVREGQPFIRYRTGDLGIIKTVECECGIKERKLALRGRVCDQLKLYGRIFSPFYYEDYLMKVEEVGLWYHFIVKSDGLTIRVEKNYGTDVSDDELKEKVVKVIKEGTGTIPMVEVVDKIPRVFTKAVRVIQEG